MQIIGDYHTHTIYSHGKGTIRDNVEAAINKGLKEIAICDHGPGHIIYGIKREQIFQMRKEVDQMNREYGKQGIRVWLGLEANVMDYDGNIDIDDEILQVLDILLLGFHYGILPRNGKSMWYFYGLNPLSKVLSPLDNTVVDLNTQAMIRAIEKYPVDIITHPGSKAKLDIEKVAEIAYKHNTALEINSHHSQLSIENIEKALNTKVKFYINSDAHHPKDVGEFQEGIMRALEAKVPIDRIINAKE
ncbi:MAG: PHP domain-containing protein [Tissierellia bacterium]|nr:PHP domain-containing protein [Tissierellia bacterium]